MDAPSWPPSIQNHETMYVPMGRVASVFSVLKDHSGGGTRTSWRFVDADPHCDDQLSQDTAGSPAASEVTPQ